MNLSKKIKIGLVILSAAWIINIFTNYSLLQKESAKEREAIQSRPYLSQLFDNRKQLYNQIKTQRNLWSTMQYLEVQYSDKPLFDEIIPFDEIQKKKRQTENRISEIESKIKDVDLDINFIYSEEEELKIINQNINKYTNRMFFPISFLFPKTEERVKYERLD
ncbi:hypothetical protein KY348_06095 [Candidatus Woesearchaeota archaeon]|nr:hypothetical protein [Candidatus Woesearchaeota archaeon]